MKFSPSRLLNQGLDWLSQTIPTPGAQNPEAVIDRSSASSRYKSLLLASILIFITSIGVRLLHWQDNQVVFDQKKSWTTALTTGYEREAKRMLEQGGILYPREPIDFGDARMLVHPPGYSILAALFHKMSGDTHTGLRLAQVICDSMAAVLVLLIAAELLPFTVALVAGTLIGFSPHLAGYSLWLSADSLSVLPILLSVCLIVRAIKRPWLITIIGAGACVGLSCWLRSNALLLAFFLAVVILLLFKRGNRLRYSLAFIAAFLLVIAPITIRNMIVFDSFIPLSLGAGITLIEGIADYDTEQRFGMPQYDKEVALKDAEWHGRPDYAGNIWSPDGVERERARFARGLAVIRSNPGWFSGVMLRRSAFMLRYNDSGPSNWPLNTAQAQMVSLESGFSHRLPISDPLIPVWTGSPVDIVAAGIALSAEAEIRLAPDNQAVEIKGDSSQFGDQFASGIIPVQKNTDYLLTLPANLINRGMAVKVTSADYRITLASGILEEPKKKKKRGGVEKDKREVIRGEENADSDSDEAMTLIEMPFASGDRTEVHLVISNDQPASAHPVVELGEAELIEVGPTAYLWTQWPRALIRGIQKNLFKTNRMLPLVLVGILLLALVRHKRALVIILAVPVYYFCTQSALHTEYRYILSIHYFLFIMAAVTLYCAGAIVGQMLIWFIRNIISYRAARS
jgi:hypothetical protein